MASAVDESGAFVASKVALKLELCTAPSRTLSSERGAMSEKGKLHVANAPKARFYEVVSSIREWKASCEGRVGGMNE